MNTLRKLIQCEVNATVITLGMIMLALAVNPKAITPFTDIDASEVTISFVISFTTVFIVSAITALAVAFPTVTALAVALVVSLAAVFGVTVAVAFVVAFPNAIAFVAMAVITAVAVAAFTQKVNRELKVPYRKVIIALAGEAYCIIFVISIIT